MTIDDSVLSEFLVLQVSIKKFQQRLDEIKEACREQGSFCTESYSCAIYLQHAVRLVGKEEAEKILGKDTLEELGLLKQHTFTIVKVAPRIPAKV